MTDFGLGDRILEKGMVDRALRWHGLDCTTEDASQTDREGEQFNEVGLVQSPDNAETSVS